MIKDQENLISDKVDTILNKFLESISRCDDAFDDGCVSRFVETYAKDSATKKYLVKKTPVSDKGKTRKGNPS